MKTIKYILLAVTILMSVNAMAVKYPVYNAANRRTTEVHVHATPSQQMSSTSQSGFSTTMPSTIYEPFGSETPSTAGNGISTRRMGYGETDEEDEPGENGNVGEGMNGQQDPDGPIGELPWLLMALLLGGYAVFSAFRRKVAA